MLEGVVMQAEILVFLSEREMQQDLARWRQLLLRDDRLHLGDMVAVGGLDAQIGTEIVREAVAGIERKRGVTMRFRLGEGAVHALGRSEVEQILRDAGTLVDGAEEQGAGALVQPEHAE